MDKDAALESKNGSKEKVEVGQIKSDAVKSADNDAAKDMDKTTFLDPIAVTEEDEDDDEECDKEIILKKEILSPTEKEDNRSSSVIVSPAIKNNIIQSKILASTTSSGLVKIAPRSTTTNVVSTSSTVTTISPTAVTAAVTSKGKIIYLQRPGASLPVRVPPTIATNASTNNGQKVAIHMIRNPHLIPVKGGKSINISNVSQLAGKKVITTSATPGQVLIKAPIKTVSGPLVQGSNQTTTTTTSAVGSTIISPMEGSKTNVRQVITSKSLLASATNGNTSGSGKMIVQNASGPRQVMVSQSVLKLSPTSSSGQLQAIQIPGKPGLQYVRVLNNTQGMPHKIGTSETPNTTTSSYTVVRQSKPGVKIMVKPSPINDKDRKMVTIPTLRKINDVFVKSNDNSDLREQKITQINADIKRFSTSSENKTAVPTSKYIVVPKSMIRSSISSQNQKTQQRQTILETRRNVTVDSQSPPPAKKLYSVLRPNTDTKEVKIKPRAEPIPVKTVTTALSRSAGARMSRSSPPPSDDSSVTIRRKHCNCTKSQCLKLYCDCFANGEFCLDCNCKDCLNNLDNEDERQKAIRICLERNPNSFKPKITAATNESDQRLHNKGCNCKRSGCLKNYCECYEAKIPCSSNCKCIGCRNVEDHPDLDMDLKKCPIPTVQTYSRVKRSYDDMAKPRTPTLQSSAAASSVPTSISTSVAVTPGTVTACGPTPEKQPCNFITQEVVDATIQCLIAQADECKKSALTPYQTEKMVMEELGKCLVEIIDFSIRNTDQN